MKATAQRAAMVRSHEGLAEYLSEWCRCHVELRVTDNRRTMISARHIGISGLRVQLHHMFLGAPQSIWEAVALFVQRRDPSASRALDEFIQSQRGLIRGRVFRCESRRVEGEHYCLREIFDVLNERYFEGQVTAEICWGRRSVRRGRSIKLGSYCMEERLIRINPVLDQVFVPYFFIASVVYHEMLHHVIPIERRGDRRCVHSAEFRVRERMFVEYERAQRWERENLHRLLRSR